MKTYQSSYIRIFYKSLLAAPLYLAVGAYARARSTLIFFQLRAWHAPNVFMDTLPISQVKNAFGIPFRSPSAIHTSYLGKVEGGSVASCTSDGCAVGGAIVRLMALVSSFESAKKSSTLYLAWRMKDLRLQQRKTNSTFCSFLSSTSQQQQSVVPWHFTIKVYITLKISYIDNYSHVWVPMVPTCSPYKIESFFLLIGTLLAVTVGTSHVIPKHLSFQITFQIINLSFQTSGFSLLQTIQYNLWVNQYRPLYCVVKASKQGRKVREWCQIISQCYYCRTPMMVRAGDKQIPSSPPAILPLLLGGWVPTTSKEYIGC